MHWMYIFKCEDNVYYVGETIRLYRRFWEHGEGRGALNTSIYEPEEIVAIYKMDTICKFIDYNKKIINLNSKQSPQFSYHSGFNNPKYVFKNWNDIDKYGGDYLEAENNIAECMMIHDKTNWKNIRGGKYTRFDVNYEFPQNSYIKELPLCKCGLPCDIRKKEGNDYLFFRCAKKNMWPKFKDQFDIDSDPCNFFMKYTKDKELRCGAEELFKKRKDKLSSLFKISPWLENVPEDKIGCCAITCVGNCNKSNYTKIKYHNLPRTLCHDCFIDKNEELSKRYSLLTGVCLIED